MKLNLLDPFDRGTMTMQMEDIVDTLSIWQTLRLWMFCRQQRHMRTTIAHLQWDRSEPHMDCKCGHCEPEELTIGA